MLFLFDRLRCRGYPLDAPIYGGAQRISFQLARRFASPGNRVFFGSDDQPGSGAVRQLTENGISHVSVPFRSPGWLSAPLAFAQLVRLIRREGISVIHSHDRWTAMFGRCVALATGIDYFYTAHIDFFNRRATGVFFGTNVTAVSEAVKRNLTTYFRMDAANVQVIYNGENIVPATDECCRAIRESYGLKAGDRIISSIGRLSAEKGHWFLLRAVARLKQDYPQLKCILVSDGDQRIRLQQLTKELGLRPHVVFCGGVEDVAPFIQLSEFTVLPSISEGFGLAAAESLLLGVPVIASRVGGVPEVIQEGLTGLLVEPKDVTGLVGSIRWMLENPERVRHMGSNGLAAVQTKFSLEAMLNAYEQYYAQRLDTGRLERASPSLS
jgi:L-malate glycosyltransferase